jgi:transcription elongation factor Elf1
MAEDTPSVHRAEPTETFGLLADETRIEILHALSDTPGAGSTFSELFDAVSLSDTGNFNYHLGQLVGTFVRKAGERYELTDAGERVVGAMLAGSFDAEASFGPVPLDWDCLQCGGQFQLRFEDSDAHLRCESCGSGLTVSIPPGAVGSVPADDLPTAVVQWYRARIQRARSGFCHRCSGRTNRRLVSGVDPDADDPTPSEVRFECRHCGTETAVSGAALVTYHPIVEGFFREHGLATDRYHPTQLWTEIESSVETVQKDPLAVEVAFRTDGELVTARVGADGVVRDVERERAGDASSVE